MKVLQINTAFNYGSHGRIASQIGDLLVSLGHESFIAYGRTYNESRSIPVRIGNKKDIIMHVIMTRLFDRHGFGSKNATKAFVSQLIDINPDIIHLHNIHGYYIHSGGMFEYLKKANKPIVWTLHDCWPFTGHCSHFDRVNCYKWQTECFDCPLSQYYPKSWFIDNSTKNFIQKRNLFSGIKNMMLVSPSDWLANHIKNSFLKSYPIRVINNGVNLNKFKPSISAEFKGKFNLQGKKIILGVANIWDNHKGLSDFVKLRCCLSSDTEIVLVGQNSSKTRKLSAGIHWISRTESIEEMAFLYSVADVFVNPTYVDNFPTTNLEALACGTPVITYNTGGSPESNSNKCGLIVPKGDIEGLCSAIIEVLSNGKGHYSSNCRARAVKLYNMNDCIVKYFNLYESL